MAEHAPVMLLTGAAGCGKTFVTKAIVGLWRHQGKRVLMCAPTGRAAQRLQEVVNDPELQASTVHRLLQYKHKGDPEKDAGAVGGSSGRGAAEGAAAGPESSKGKGKSRSKSRSPSPERSGADPSSAAGGAEAAQKVATASPVLSDSLLHWDDFKHGPEFPLEADAGAGAGVGVGMAVLWGVYVVALRSFFSALSVARCNQPMPAWTALALTHGHLLPC